MDLYYAVRRFYFFHITRSYKAYFLHTNQSYIFREQFLLLATMTKAIFANSQQLLIIILFLCEVITLNKINMNSYYFYSFSLFFYSLKIMAK